MLQQRKPQHRSNTQRMQTTSKVAERKGGVHSTATASAPARTTHLDTEGALGVRGMDAVQDCRLGVLSKSIHFKFAVVKKFPGATHVPCRQLDAGTCKSRDEELDGF